MLFDPFVVLTYSCVNSRSFVLKYFEYFFINNLNSRDRIQLPMKQYQSRSMDFEE